MRGICFCSRAAKEECNLLIAAAAKRGHHAESYTARQSMLACSLISISPAVLYRRVIHHVSHPPHSAHAAGGGPQVRSLFSASLSEAVEGLARSMMHAPLRVTVGDRGAAAPSVHQSLLFVGRCARPSWRACPSWLARPSWRAHTAFADNARAIIFVNGIFFSPHPPFHHSYHPSITPGVNARMPRLSQRCAFTALRAGPTCPRGSGRTCVRGCDVAAQSVA